MKKNAVHVLGKGCAELGEGPVWDPRENTLYWVDIKGQAIFRHIVSDDKTERFGLSEPVGCVVPCRAGGWVVALASGFARIEHWNSAPRPLCNPEPHLPNNRFNDGKCDTTGRLWAGTMDDAERACSGSLYRLDADHRVHAMVHDLGISNGLGWSPDDTRFYLTDSTRKTIWVYDHDAPSGSLSNRRVFAQVPDGAGWPDGLTIDRDGGVWSAHWDGWRLTRYTPDGQVDRTVPLPVPRPTSCTFGGEHAATLFVTSARTGLSAHLLEQAPLSGSVLTLETGTSGLPPNLFAG
ncbi:MAG: SMP-30/gluconolactonase/LRE family protein [Magnetococcus sp. MYC-9]